MRDLLGRLALLTGSLLIAFVVFEVGLRLAGYEPIYAVYSKPSIFWVHDDTLGWRHEPGASGTYVGPRPWPVEFRTPIRINSLGLRGPELAPLPAGGRRILVLGDSFVAGFEVTDEETFVHRIGLELTKRLGAPVQLVNGGVRGYGTDQALLYYTTRGRALEPDLVVMLHSGNDASDNTTLHRMRRPFGKAAFALREGGELELVGTPIPRYPLCSAWALDASFDPARFDGLGARGWCRIQTGLADHSALLTFVSSTLQRMPGLLKWIYGLGSTPELASRPLHRAGLIAAGGGPQPLSPEQGHALTWRLYEELAREVRADGARFLAVIGSQLIQRFDADAVAASDVPLHRLQIASRIHRPEDLRFRNDAHFNALGHRLLAEHLTPVFEEALAGDAGR
jgi:lysophospholipase L1-like esterase